MTIQDFDQALQEQGSEIQQAFGKLKEREVREAVEDSALAPWTIWT